MSNVNFNLISGLLAAAILVTAPSAWSETTYNQSSVDINAFGWDSVGGTRDVQQIADDFHLPIDGSITRLSWTGKYHEGAELAAKRFEVRIFSDMSGKPGSEIFAHTVMAAGVDLGLKDSGGHDLLTYSVPLKKSITLSSAKTYWLSIREDDPSTSALWSWSFHNADIPGGFSYRRGENAQWSVGTTDMAYSLSVHPKD
jgi:hypothetical protein